MRLQYIDKLEAIESWRKAGLNEKGMQAVSAWIGELADNLAEGQGRWDFYAPFALYKSDPHGSLELLASAVKMTGAKHPRAAPLGWDR